MAAKGKAVVDSFRRLLIAAVFPGMLAACDSQVNATGSATQDPGQSKPVAARSASTTLPEKTNNAWEMTPFSLPALDGENHGLEDWKGKVIMMNFWASWCAPCQYEIPEFVQYQKQYADRNLQIVGIGVDDKRPLENVARSLGINYPVLVLDPMDSRQLMRKWGNDTGIIPYTVVIASDGRIKYIHRGQMDEDAFNSYVLPLLQ